MIFEDQLATLESDSKAGRHAGPNIDFALLVDGLPPSVSRHHHRCRVPLFSTEKRKFIVADNARPRASITRNMVTGASTADLAVILIDARKGILTKRGGIATSST